MSGSRGSTSPMADKPLWRQAFDAVEQRAAGPVEGAAHSDLFGDLVTLNVRLARRAQQEVERRTRRVLHLVNLPTATDVRRLSEQVASLQREVRELEDRRP
jgi:hypothetical protein